MVYAKGRFALLALITMPAGAIELSLVGNDRLGEDFVQLGLSESAKVSFWLDIGEDDGNVTFIIANYDASPLNDGDTTGFEIVDRRFAMQRNNGDPWVRYIHWDGDPNIEEYMLIAADVRGEWGPGTNGPWAGPADDLIIHGTEVGIHELYFENPVTVDPGHAPRIPQLYAGDYRLHVYAQNLDLPGFIRFRNAWSDRDIGFDVPFRVIVTPEPGSALAMGILGLLCASRRLGLFRPK